MKIFDLFKVFIEKPSSPPSSPKNNPPRKIPSPPIMKNPKVQKIIKERSGFKALSGISIELAKETEAIMVEWDAMVKEVQPEDQEWADEMCCQVPRHKEKHGKKYAVKGNWALEKGLMNKGDGLVDLDDEFLFSEEECKCRFIPFRNLRDLPESMMTEKGKKELERVRAVR